MKFSAFRDNVILLLEPTKRMNWGGLHLPETGEYSEFGPRYLAARVLDAGPGGMGADGIYYPVDVLEQIGGDIIAAEEGEGLEEEQALRDRFNNVTNGQSSAGSLDGSDNASGSENIDGMEDDDSADSSETARDEDGVTSP